MQITAKFSSICPCCNQPLEAGSKVEWQKGQRARHIACQPNALPASGRISMAALSAHVASQPRSRGGYAKRTGCSCGSREDSSGCLIPSPRNCAGCEHDA